MSDELRQPNPQIVGEFIERAMRGADGLSLTARAEFHLAAAKLLDGIDAERAQLARHTAAFLREADAHQARLFESLAQL